jgi:carbon monoxide dehydrogenase subunit G
MQEYTSKQVQIRRPAAMVYGALSDFTNFTPVIRDRVEGWEATPDECSFTVKGMRVGLRIVEREQDKLIKLTGAQGVPFEFTLWIQLREVGPSDTRMRLVLHAKLNMMMRMMLGKKLEEGVDQAAQQIADMFNNLPV